MKKNLLWMFAAILFCGAMTTSCGSDDDDNSGSNTEIVGMRIAYAVEFLPDYDTLEDYTVSVTWTDSNGKDVTETITKDFVKDVMLKSTQSTHGTFVVKCTPTNSNKEKHDIGLSFAVLAKPMNSVGDVSDSEMREGSNFIFHDRTGEAYKEFSYSVNFQLVDGIVRKTSN